MERAFFAVSPGLKHKFTGPQLATLGMALGADAVIELTTFQQLLVSIPADRAEAAKATIAAAGLTVYAAGPVVKNLRTCSFCQGDDVEGYPTALALDAAIAGMAVPFTLKAAYTGCPNGCAEPLMQDLAVIKQGEDNFDIYAGGKAGGLQPQVAQKVAAGLTEGGLIPAVQGIIGLYQKEGQRRERFWQFVQRVGVEAIAAAAK